MPHGQKPGNTVKIFANLTKWWVWNKSKYNKFFAMKTVQFWGKTKSESWNWLTKEKISYKICLQRILTCHQQPFWKQENGRTDFNESYNFCCKKCRKVLESIKSSPAILSQNGEQSKSYT